MQTRFSEYNEIISILVTIKMGENEQNSRIALSPVCPKTG